MKQIAELRREYTRGGLRRADLCPDPIDQFEKWFTEAVKAEILDPNAMTLATADITGRPSARTVLLKAVDRRGFTFFTNYKSRKGRDLVENPNACLLFFWRELERQARVIGTIARVSREESEAYFKTRPEASRLAAWCSEQSEPIPSREVLERKLAEKAREFEGGDIPLPPHWGGYLLKPSEIEFWQGRPSRLHDRFLYAKTTNGEWRIQRLSP